MRLTACLFFIVLRVFHGNLKYTRIYYDQNKFYFLSSLSFEVNALLGVFLILHITAKIKSPNNDLHVVRLQNIYPLLTQIQLTREKETELSLTHTRDKFLFISWHTAMQNVLFA